MTKNILFLLCIFYFISCKGQDKTKELKFPQVGWTLSIPSNSDFLTTAQFDSLQNATKKKTDLNIELSKDEVLFVIKKDNYNYFGSSVTAFDTSNFKIWETSYAFYKKSLVDLLLSKSDLITLLDTSSSIEKIDGLTFQKFYTKTAYPKQNLILENYWYYRKQGSLELSINILFDNKKNGDQYLELLKSSKFDK